ncbi:MAG: hypothetical protein EOO27_23910 [Comamonadaceae bacterium]|nr:MAG: hypothetical protein EOO27_23910 [Comamonadaceae bacterium]
MVRGFRRLLIQSQQENPCAPSSAPSRATSTAGRCLWPSRSSASPTPLARRRRPRLAPRREAAMSKSTQGAVQAQPKRPSPVRAPISVRKSVTTVIPIRPAAANESEFAKRPAAVAAVTLAPLAYEGARVRTMTDDTGAVWFAATDVARVLGFRCAPDMTRMLDEDEAAMHILRIRSANGVVQARKVSFVNESGVYGAAMRSRRADAKRFRRWVTGEVLPSLRRDGMFSMAGGMANAAAVGVNLWRQRLEVERRADLSQKFASTGARWMREHQVRSPNFKASILALDAVLNPVLNGLGIPSAADLRAKQEAKDKQTRKTNGKGSRAR